jgi:hypothetical protein
MSLAPVAAAANWRRKCGQSECPTVLTMDLVILHGRAAAGKLTTARALEERLGWPVFHNHLVVDLLTELFPLRSDPFVRLREQMWL